jgi:hypothetical protein
VKEKSTFDPSARENLPVAGSRFREEEGKCAPESDEGNARGNGFKYPRPVSPVTGIE